MWPNTFSKKILSKKAYILSDADLKNIQGRIDRMSVPSDIGRIPHKIESSFYHFTAPHYTFNFFLTFLSVLLGVVVG